MYDMDWVANYLYERGEEEMAEAVSSLEANFRAVLRSHAVLEEVLRQMSVTEEIADEAYR